MIGSKGTGQPLPILGYDLPKLYIDGKWIGPHERPGEAIVNPFDEATLGELPFATSADLDVALEAALRGFQTWREVSPKDRASVLKGAASKLRGQIPNIARMISLELGKPIAEARMEVQTAADDLEWFAEEGRRSYGRVIPTRLNGSRFIVTKEPVGPVAAFSAWNFPVINATRKLGAALAAGCSCVYKPAEDVPSPALAVVRALLDSGLPNDVIAAVFGQPSDISAHLIASPAIRKISFTGSVAVGKHLMRLAANGMKRTTMELGGHAPVLVFDDVDVEMVASVAVQRKFRNAGQVCVSPTRFLVHEKVYDRFLESFVANARALKVGDPLDETTQMGPLAHARRLEAIEALVSDAVESGAHLASGGNRIGNRGYLYEPTVLANTPVNARIMNEEPFGPVAIINRFSDVSEALVEANRLPFGLAAYAFSRRIDVALSIGDRLEAGLVGINSFNIAMPDAPFGGVKESGHGLEDGKEGLEACLVSKTISYA